MARRILCVLDRLSARGGAERYLGEVVDALLDAGWECHAAWGHDDPTAAPLARRLASSRRLRRLDRRTPHAREDALCADLAALVDELRPDAILVQNVMGPAPLHALAATPHAVAVVQDHRVFCPARGKVFPDGQPCRVGMGSPCDACFVGDGGLDATLRDRRVELTRARLAAVRRFRRIVVLSRYVRDELVQAGVTPTAITVVPPAATPWALAAAPVPPSSERRGLAVPGRVAWHKGGTFLVEALAGAGVQAPVTFAGDGPGRDRLLETARRRGMTVSVTGWLSDPELSTRLGSARLVALPSLWAEPFGIAGIEAGALGLPVVATDVGGVHEWLEDELTGLLVPPADPPALAEAVRRLLADPRRADELGQAARTCIRERFPAAAFRETWRRLAETVAGET